jgi:hypothetical protein
VNVTGKWQNHPDEPSYVYHVDAWGIFDPTCDYVVGTPSFTYEIVDGADINSHKLKFDFSTSGKYSRFCPTFNGHVTLTLDGTEVV